MRVVTVDQFEFENPSTEEFVEVAVAKLSAFPFPSVGQFVAARISAEASVALPAAAPFDLCPGSSQARKHLFKFAGISVPEACSWQTYRFSSEPDSWALVACAPGQFIHYHWGTSA